MSIFALIGNFLKNKIFSRFKAKAVVMIVSILCVISLTYQYFMQEDAVSPMTIVGAAIVPFQEGMNEAGGFLFDREQRRISHQEALAKIESLQSENDALKLKNEELQALDLQNRELRDLLSAKERFGNYEMMEAEVIGNDGVSCFERFTINVGTLDGVQVNMNVINADGLIGIVTHVGLNYAIVTSIIEDNMSVSAMTKNGNENCIVRGDIKLREDGLMQFSDLPADVNLEKDGTLVTSNISDKYLQGFPIGYVEEVKTDEGGLTQSGTLKTAVDFKRIRQVLVVKTMKEGQMETEAAK